MMILQKNERNLIHKSMIGLIITLASIFSVYTLYLSFTGGNLVTETTFVAKGEIQNKYNRNGANYFVIDGIEHRVNRETMQSNDVGSIIELENTEKYIPGSFVFNLIILAITLCIWLSYLVSYVMLAIESYQRWLKTGYWTQKGLEKGTYYD